MATGVSAAGLQSKTLQEIFSEIEADLLSEYDAELDTSEDAAIGQIARIAAAKLREGWELLETAYGGFDEASAEGSQLENIAALTGSYREPATKGTAVINCTLVSGTSLTTSATVGHATEDSNRWTLREAFTAPSTGVHALLFECTRTGRIEALAGSLNVIKTPVAGWSSASNPSDADAGKEIEAYEDLRIRRREELRAQGSCTVPAQYADLLTVDGVISARVFENATSSTVDGIPPHAIEAVIWDGASAAASNADVWGVLKSNKPGGVQAYGLVATTFLDESGAEISVGFTRATQVPVTVVIQVAIDAEEYPLDGDDRIKAAIVAYGDALRTGNDVFRMQVMSASTSIPGVKDVPACTINGVAANIAINKRSIAVFDTSTITVTTVAAAV